MSKFQAVNKKVEKYFLHTLYMDKVGCKNVANVTLTARAIDWHSVSAGESAEAHIARHLSVIAAVEP